MFRTAVCRSRSRASREESPGGSRQPCGAVAALGCKDPVTPLVITVTAVSPARDLLGGGTAVTITGINFTDVISVMIGGSELVNRTSTDGPQHCYPYNDACSTVPVTVSGGLTFLYSEPSTGGTRAALRPAERLTAGASIRSANLATDRTTLVQSRYR